MFCQFCGGEVAQGAYFCPVCGQDISGAAVPPAPLSATPERTSGKALGSLICGIFVFFFPLSVAAVILGHLSLSEIRKSSGRIAGRGLAIAGLVLGYIGLAAIPIVLILAAIAIPNLMRARKAANEASAVSTVRSLNSAENSYAQDHNGKFTCSLPTLRRAGLIDEVTASGFRNSYLFHVYCRGDGGPPTGYRISAFPVAMKRSGPRIFCSDETGIIKWAPGNSATDCWKSGNPL